MFDRPYASLASNIPLSASSGCDGNFPQETHQGNHCSIAASNQLTGVLTLTAANHFLCGDQMLSGDETVNAPAGAVLIIESAGDSALSRSATNMSQRRAIVGGCAPPP